MSEVQLVGIADVFNRDSSEIMYFVFLMKVRESFAQNSLYVKRSSHTNLICSHEVLHLITFV